MIKKNIPKIPIVQSLSSLLILTLLGLTVIFTIICGTPSTLYADGPPAGKLPYLVLNRVFLDCRDEEPLGSCEFLRNYDGNFYGGGWMIEAFIPTDAERTPGGNRLLCTLNDVADLTQAELFTCRSGHYQDMHGIFVAVMLRAPYTPRGEEYATITMMEEGAKNYGTPIGNLEFPE